MSNFFNELHECDLANLELVRTNLLQLQNDGLFPKSFEMPITVQYELMMECSLHCLHCYNRSGDADLSTRMKLDNWIDLSKHMVDQGGIFQCILSGGEPLLMGPRRLPQIMDILHEDGTSFVMITNALNFDKQWLDILLNYRFFWIQVSIDGSDASYHDYFRGVEGSWKKCIETSLMLSKAGIPLVISHTVTPKNINNMEAMVSLAYELGAASIIMGEVLPSGRANDHADEILLSSNEARILLHHNIERLAIQFKGKIEVQRSIGTSYQLKRYQVLPNMGCIIRPDGSVRLDCMAPFTIGNVLEKSFKEIWIDKSSNCWQDSRVNDYIKEIDICSNKNPKFLNHVQQDILI